MLKEKHENMYSIFGTYYDSCVQYERNINFSDRIKMGKLKLYSIYFSMTLKRLI